MNLADNKRTRDAIECAGFRMAQAAQQMMRLPWGEEVGQARRHLKAAAVILAREQSDLAADCEVEKVSLAGRGRCGVFRDFSGKEGQ